MIQVGDSKTFYLNGFGSLARYLPSMTGTELFPGIYVYYGKGGEECASNRPEPSMNDAACRFPANCLSPLDILRLGTKELSSRKAGARMRTIRT